MNKYIVIPMLIFFLSPPPCIGADVYAPLKANNTRVPQTLLALVHTPEVQAEIGITPENRTEFEDQLRAIDREWWPSRILPQERQRDIVGTLEERLIRWMDGNANSEAKSRLRQIELQAQGYRCLLRDEVRRHLKMTSNQLRILEKIVDETDTLAKTASKKSTDVSLQKSLQETKKKEPERLSAVLTSEQNQQLNRLIGPTFATENLQRIYPFAPELLDVDRVIGNEKPSIESLRGKVVIVHFYAFQCHNCIANFPHYKRWHRTLSEQGVAIVGIQTPELPDERSPRNIEKAAKSQELEFPILMDLDKKNWDAWGNTMWPTVYVIDKNGYIRFWWQGELNWQGAKGDSEIEALVKRLLAES